jgi:hypothetical protein
LGPAARGDFHDQIEQLRSHLTEMAKGGINIDKIIEDIRVFIVWTGCPKDI